MKGRNAFSLVEVTMALGILSFALLAIIGLLNVGLGASRTAQIETMQSTIVRSILASVRTNNPGGFTGDTHWYAFDGTETNESAAFFQCVVSTNTPPLSISSGDMAAVMVRFQYPVSAPPTNRQEKIIHASFTRQP
jgi:uncharacterized protein (TIGR02598 family)